MKHRSRAIARIRSTRPGVMSEPLRLTLAASWRPGAENGAALASSAGSQLDHEIGAGNRDRIVLDDYNRVAEIAQMAQHLEQPVGVGGVEADGRFVERVHRAGKTGAQRAREMNTLRLAARERARLAFQRQVAETDFVEIAGAVL